MDDHHLDTRTAPPPWWISPGPDYCMYCESAMHAEAMVYCIACDSPLCPTCVVEVLDDGVPMCPDCARQGQGDQ